MTEWCGLWCVVYWVVSTLMSLFYGLFAVRIWPIAGEHKKCWYVHQFFFNMLGSLVGWAAGYYVLWVRVFGGSTLEVIDIVVLLIAMLGITGYLPNTIAGISTGVHGLAKKLAGQA